MGAGRSSGARGSDTDRCARWGRGLYVVGLAVDAAGWHGDGSDANRRIAGRSRLRLGWDGMAAGRAGQIVEVPTPYGVLDGVARFGWTGTAWAAVGAPTFQRDFTSGSLGAGAVFTRASTGTYYNSSGVLVSAATNAPRFDYDPVTHALRGQLNEDARTNTALQSANFALSWSTSDITLTAGISGAPDGTASMTRTAETATTALHFLIQNITAVASAAYTLSIHAKAAENRYLELSLDDSGGSNGGFAVFDLQAGTVTQAVARGTGVLGASAIVAVG